MQQIRRITLIRRLWLIIMMLLLGLPHKSYAHPPLFNPSTHLISPTTPDITCQVTSFADSGSGSLRDYVANSACDRITFAPNLLNATITLVNPITPTHNLTIDGEGKNIRIDGNQKTRMFSLTEKQLNMNIYNLTLQNSGSSLHVGGAIYITPTATLVLSNSQVLSNTVSFWGGGIANNGVLNIYNTELRANNAREGGAIYNTGSLNIQKGKFIANKATIGGAGIYNIKTLTVTQTLFNQNISNSLGAGIYNLFNTAVIRDSTFSQNLSYGGSAIFNSSSPNSTPSITLTNSIIRDNSAQGIGGGIYNRGKIHIADTHVIYNTSTEGGSGVANYFGLATITNSKVMTNTSSDNGGGIENTGTITLTQSLVRNNQALRGGGIAHTNGRLSLIQSTIEHNQADFSGGGVYNDALLNMSQTTIQHNQSNTTGGGIYNNWANINIVQSTFNANTAQSGGGLYNYLGTINLNRTTLHANTANTGGGIENYLGTVNLVETTLSRNQATFSGGGIYNESTLSLETSIVAQNNSVQGGADITNTSNGNISTSNYNLIGSNATISNQFSPLSISVIGGTVMEGATLPFTITLNSRNLVGTPNTPLDAKLGNLADNGGPTQTMLPQAGSPAINNGPVNSTFTTDQRGFARMVGPKVDIGAVETSSTTTNGFTINYQTQDGSALALVDYTPISGTITLSLSTPNITIFVPTLVDSILEITETMQLHVYSSLSGNVYANGLIYNHTGTLILPTLNISDSMSYEVQGITTTMLFTVTLSSITTQNVQFSYQTHDGSATHPNDYLAQNGTLTIPAGQRLLTIPIVIVGDNLVEPSETFIFSISNPGNATIVDESAIGTILDAGMRLWMPIVLRN